MHATSPDAWSVPDRATKSPADRAITPPAAQMAKICDALTQIFQNKSPTWPSSGSYRRSSSATRVDFPEPLRPTSANSLPGSRVKLSPLRAGVFLRVAYE